MTHCVARRQIYTSCIYAERERNFMCVCVLIRLTLQVSFKARAKYIWHAGDCIRWRAVYELSRHSCARAKQKWTAKLTLSRAPQYTGLDNNGCVRYKQTKKKKTRHKEEKRKSYFVYDDYKRAVYHDSVIRHGVTRCCFHTQNASLSSTRGDLFTHHFRAYVCPQAEKAHTTRNKKKIKNNTTCIFCV